MIPRLQNRRRPDFSFATINIVFLLLLFFLLAGTMLQRAETDIDIPLTERLRRENLPRPLLVISDDAALLLDGAPLGPGDLAGAVSASLNVRGAYISVLADRNLPARALLDVLAILSASGIPARIVTVEEDRPGRPE